MVGGSDRVTTTHHNILISVDFFFFAPQVYNEIFFSFL